MAAARGSAVCGRLRRRYAPRGRGRRWCWRASCWCCPGAGSRRRPRAFMLRERVASAACRRASAGCRFEQISPQLAIAVVAAEDQRFPQHNGFDFDAIERALEESAPQAAGRLHDLAAGREEPLPVAGPQLRAQGARGLAHRLHRGAVAEAAHPRGVSEHGRVRARRVRRGAASEHLLREARAASSTLGEASLLAAALPSPKRSSRAKPSDVPAAARAAEIEARCAPARRQRLSCAPLSGPRGGLAVKKLTVRDAAALLNVSEKSVYRWIKQGVLPAYRVNDQYRINRAELLEWATARKMHVSPEIFAEPENDAEPAPTLEDALRAGGIHYRVGGHDKPSALQRRGRHPRPARRRRSRVPVPGPARARGARVDGSRGWHRDSARAQSDRAAPLAPDRDAVLPRAPRRLRRAGRSAGHRALHAHQPDRPRSISICCRVWPSPCASRASRRRCARRPPATRFTARCTPPRRRWSRSERSAIPEPARG